MVEIDTKGTFKIIRSKWEMGLNPIQNLHLVVLDLINSFTKYDMFIDKFIGMNNQKYDTAMYVDMDIVFIKTFGLLPEQKLKIFV